MVPVPTESCAFLTLRAFARKVVKNTLIVNVLLEDVVDDAHQ